MSFAKEPTGYEKTILSDLQGAWSLLRQSVYLGHVTIDDFRKNPRSELGTRTATLHKDGIQKLRRSWVYRVG